jgi:ferredoxin
MRAHVDPAKCQGHTLCAGQAPAVFKLRDDNGHAYTDDDEDVPPELEDAVRRAALGCPEGAITIEE